MTNDTSMRGVPETMEPQPGHGLVRLRDDRILGGVGSGIARHWNVDPWLPRIGFLIMAVMGGLGVLLYLAAWVLMPEEGAERSIAEGWVGGLRGAGAWLGVFLIVAAGVWIAAATELVSAGLAWGIALLVVGVLLYRGRLPEPPLRPPRRPVPPERPPERAAEAVEVPEPVVVPEARPARARPPRSILGRLTFGALFVTIGVMAALDAAGLTHPALRHYAVAMVLVVGSGLLIGIWFGRSRGLIVFGLSLLPFLFASVAVTAPFTGGFGDPTYRPLSPAEVVEPYRLAAGDLQLDLRGIDLAEGEVLEVEASVGAGRLYVMVPADAGLEVTGHVGFGEVSLLGVDDGGIDVDRRLERRGR
ncbi:MAG TPA: PspC domain-containing protein, partial [Gemmatimonadales bacterium]|nr:PspC domain-containing protein [Gemmatimonadales bacterium]